MIQDTERRKKTTPTQRNWRRLIEIKLTKVNHRVYSMRRIESVINLSTNFCSVKNMFFRIENERTQVISKHCRLVVLHRCTLFSQLN